MRYAISGPSLPSYASCAIAREKGSRYLATRSGPASTGFETDLSNQPRGDLLRVAVVSAEQEALGHANISQTSTYLNSTAKALGLAIERKEEYERQQTS